MDKIRTFIAEFLKEETIAHVEFRKKNNKEIFNSQLEKLYSYTINYKIQSKISFGLGKMNTEHEDYFFEDIDLLPEIKERHLYKVSEYNYNYEKIWACYVSVSNPTAKKTKSISTCFIIGEVDGEYKIVAQYRVDYDTYKWRFVGGDRTIDYYKLGKPVAIQRIMSPENDPWSIEEYNRNR